MRRMRWMLAIGLLVVFGLAGCGGGGGTPPQESIKEQAKTVWTRNQEITQTVNTEFDRNDPQTWQKIARKIQTLPYVTSVSVEDRRIIVRYKNGWEAEWFDAPEPQVPVWPRQSLRVPTRELVGSKRAIVIFTFKPEDAGYEVNKTALENVKTTLFNSGYNPVYVEGEMANVELFKNLNPYGVIVICTHGNIDSIQTGEVVYNNECIEKYSDDLSEKVKRIRLSTAVGSKFTKISIQPCFISYYYSPELFPQHHFQHALVYIGACLSYHPNSHFPKAFLDNGVAGYLGWTDEVTKSAFTAASLFGYMATGKSIKETYANLPHIFFDDFEWEGKNYHSELTWNRPDANSLQIINPEGYSPVYSFRATGDYSGHIADIEVTNESNSPTTVYIAGGTTLDNPEESEQDLVVTRKIDFSVQPGDSRVEPVYGACINLHKDSPENGRVIFISETQSSDLLALGAAAERLGTSDQIAQIAVWVITDRLTPDSEYYEEVRDLFSAAGLNLNDYPALRSRARLAPDKSRKLLRYKN